MQLVIRRSQKTTGMISKSVSFVLDARVDLSNEEGSAVKKYALGSQVLYNSANAKQYLDKAQGSGFLGAVANVAMAKMSLNISIDSLTKGQHIECKDLDELLGAEEAIRNACQSIRTYIDVAQTFDGREIVVDIEQMATA
jgi:hypothetical protein